MDKHSKKAFSDEPAAALRKWKAAMARFDAAAPDEAKCRGPCQYLHPLHHGAGNCVHHRHPLPQL